MFVPLSALFYTAFTEDTGFGPGPWSLQNFVEAYSSWHIVRLFGNSVDFRRRHRDYDAADGRAGRWVVERTDAPGGSLFHALALLSFAMPGLLTAMAWIFVLSPNIGWLNALFKSAFGLKEAPFSIYTMGGMIWALSSHYFPLAYLALGPALRVLDVRHGGGGAGLRRALLAGDAEGDAAAVAAGASSRPCCCCSCSTMSSYEVPRLIGRPARIDVFTTDIQAATQSAPPEFGIGERARITLLAICIIAVFFYRRATRNAEAFATITGKGYMPTRIALRHWRWPVAIAIGLMFTVSLGLPLLTLVWQSFYRNLAQPFMGSTGAGVARELRVHPAAIRSLSAR